MLNDVAVFPKGAVTEIIINQMVRSVSSISSNIAEGFNARSAKQYLNYLDISKRSTGKSENRFPIKDFGNDILKNGVYKQTLIMSSAVYLYGRQLFSFKRLP